MYHSQPLLLRNGLAPPGPSNNRWALALAINVASLLASGHGPLRVCWVIHTKTYYHTNNVAVHIFNTVLPQNRMAGFTGNGERIATTATVR